MDNVLSRLQTSHFHQNEDLQMPFYRLLYLEVYILLCYWKNATLGSINLYLTDRASLEALADLFMTDKNVLKREQKNKQEDIFVCELNDFVEQVRIFEASFTDLN